MGSQNHHRNSTRRERSRNLHYSEVPVILQEDYILTGYRPINKPWSFYINSIFKINNETLNVWTHLLGGLIILIKLLSVSTMYDVWSDKRIWPIIMFGVCCLFTHGLSVMAHILHSKSCFVHYFVFLMDYMGVALYAFGTHLIAMYSCSDRDAYEFFKSFYVPLTTFTSWANYVIMCVAKISFGGKRSAIKRRSIQVFFVALQIGLISLPFAPRYVKCFRDEACALTSLNHISVTFITIATGAFFFASHFPDRLLPGTFDIFGQGHQLFHIFSTITQVLEMSAVYKDIQAGIAEHSDPDIGSMVMYFITLCSAMVAFLLYVKKYIPRDKKKE